MGLRCYAQVPWVLTRKFLSIATQTRAVHGLVVNRETLAMQKPTFPSRPSPRLVRLGVLTAMLLLAAAPALASGGGGSAMPWDDKLSALADSITGPVAKSVGVIAIALTGLGVAFSEGGSWVRRGLSIIFGLSIAFTASTFALTFLDFTGGAGF